MNPDHRLSMATKIASFAGPISTRSSPNAAPVSCMLAALSNPPGANVNGVWANNCTDSLSGDLVGGVPGARLVHAAQYRDSSSAVPGPRILTLRILISPAGNVPVGLKTTELSPVIDCMLRASFSSTMPRVALNAVSSQSRPLCCALNPTDKERNTNQIRYR